MRGESAEDVRSAKCMMHNMMHVMCDVDVGSQHSKWTQQ